ncbi:MAG TPA: hypothetical protein VMT46_10675 [Anaerolineaceae bacterium]|nr:hypothetical protein [Anaerolineaceae bacterium]
MLSLTDIPLIQSLIQILPYIVVLAVIWIAIRFIFRLATRILFTGCGLILLLGLAIVVFRMLGS